MLSRIVSTLYVVPKDAIRPLYIFQKKFSVANQSRFSLRFQSIANILLTVMLQLLQVKVTLCHFVPMIRYLPDLRIQMIQFVTSWSLTFYKEWFHPTQLIQHLQIALLEQIAGTIKVKMTLLWTWKLWKRSPMLLMRISLRNAKTS